MEFRVYGMALYWPTLQFYVCVYLSFVCRSATWRPWRVLLQHSLMLPLVFIVECGIARFLDAVRVFELVPKNFVSFAASVAELAHGEKSAYSITLTHPAYLMGVQTLRTQHTSDQRHFGPRTLRHVRSVQKTLWHWCQSVFWTL